MTENEILGLVVSIWGIGVLLTIFGLSVYLAAQGSSIRDEIDDMPIVIALFWPIAVPITLSIWSGGAIGRLLRHWMQARKESKALKAQEQKLREIEIQRAIKQLEKEGL